MQDFAWNEKWNAIVLRYCVGYTNDSELVDILKKAKECLELKNEKSKRSAT